MARVSIYLNFMGNTEEAFEFYKTVFNTDYSEQYIHTMKPTLLMSPVYQS